MEKVFKVIYTKVSNLEEKLNEAAGNLYIPNIINHIPDSNMTDPMVMVICIKAPPQVQQTNPSVVVPKIIQAGRPM